MNEIVQQHGYDASDSGVVDHSVHLARNDTDIISPHNTTPPLINCVQANELASKNPFAAHLLNNSSVLEVALVCLTCPISAFMRDLIVSWMSGGRKLSTWCRFIVDCLSLGLPGIYCMTLFSDTLHDLHTILICVIGALFLWHLNKNDIQSQHRPLYTHDRCSLLQLPMAQRRDFVSYFRAYVNFAASVAILAVDFPSVFPTRFGKRQTFGTGLMDVGVGGYVVSYGIVALEARGKVQTGSETPDKIKHILRAVKSSAPMWILGMVRTIFILVTGFHTHVTEYGKHWNFFFTLAFVRVASAVVLTIFPARFAWIGSILLMITFQYTVQTNNLSRYIFLGPADDMGSRKGLLNANREGLASCFGYLSIYLASVSIGHFLALPRKTFKDWLKALLLLLILDAVLYNILLNMMRTEPMIEPISRCTANLPFVIWMMAHQVFMICCFFVVDLMSTALAHCEIIHKSDQTEFSLMEAVNRNGLLYFVLANILVGVVNVSVDALWAPSYVGYGVLLIYMFVLAAVCAALHIKNITLKCW